MRWIILRELKRDQRIHLYGLGTVIALGLIRMGWAQYDLLVVFPASLVLDIIVPVVSLVMIVPALFYSDKMSHIEEYFLALPLKRWQVWTARMCYGLAVVIVYTGTAILLPYPVELPHGLVDALNETPLVVIPYLFLLLVIAHSLLVSIQATPRGQRTEIPGQLALSIIFFLLSMVLLRFPHYLILALPVIFSFGLVAMASAVAAYCHYRWKWKTAFRVSLFFAASLTVLTAFQTGFSLRQLHSLRPADRTTAFYMCLYVFEREAFFSYSSIDGDFRERKDLLIPMVRTLMENENQARKLDPLWRKEFAAGDRFQQTVAVAMLSMEGPDDQLAVEFLDRLERDSSLGSGLYVEELANLLMLLTPANKQVVTIIHLLRSEKEDLRHIGYYCVKHHPDNSLIPPLLDSIKRETQDRGFWRQQAAGQLNLITLHEIRPRVEEVADVPRAIEDWERWAERKADQPFADRVNVILTSRGVAVPYISLSNEDLFRIFEIEMDRERGSPRSVLTDILLTTLMDRLHLLERFCYTDEFGQRYYIPDPSNSNFYRIEERVFADKPIWYKIIHML